MKLFLIIFLLLFIGVSCRHSDSTPFYIQKAEQLIRDNPDSAVLWLRQCRDSVRQAPDSTQVLYLLLRINARDAADVPFTTDDKRELQSVLHSHRNDKAGLPGVYYYAARIYYDLQDVPQALDYALKALDVGRADTSKKLMSSICQFIAYIYEDSNMDDKALSMFKRALNYRKATKDSLSVVHLYTQVAWMYGALGDSVNCYRSFHQAIHLAKKLRNEVAACRAYQELGAYYTEFGNYAKGFEFIQKSLAHPDTTYMWPVYATKGMYYFYTNQLDSSHYYYTKLTAAPEDMRKRVAYQSLGQIAMKRKDYKTAATLYERYMMYADSALYKDNTKASKQIAEQYDYQLRERENAKLKAEAARQKIFTILLTVSFVLFIAIAVTLYEFYKRKEEKRRGRLEKIIAASEEHENAVAALFKTDIYTKFRSAEKPLQEQDWQRLSVISNDAYPDFFERLSDFYPMSVIEKRVSFLLKLEFSPSQIAIITAHSRQAITSIRKRLAEKALDSSQPSAEQWDRFIRKF